MSTTHGRCPLLPQLCLCEASEGVTGERKDGNGRRGASEDGSPPVRAKQDAKTSRLNGAAAAPTGSHKSSVTLALQQSPGSPMVSMSRFWARMSYFRAFLAHSPYDTVVFGRSRCVLLVVFRWSTNMHICTRMGDPLQQNTSPLSQAYADSLERPPHTQLLPRPGRPHTQTLQRH